MSESLGLPQLGKVDAGAKQGVVHEHGFAVLHAADVVLHPHGNRIDVAQQPAVHSAEDLDGQRGLLTGEDIVL